MISNSFDEAIIPRICNEEEALEAGDSTTAKHRRLSRSSSAGHLLATMIWCVCEYRTAVLELLQSNLREVRVAWYMDNE